MPRQCPHTITLTATPAIDTRLDGSMFFEPNLHKTRKFFPVFSYAILVNLAEGANVVVFTMMCIRSCTYLGCNKWSIDLLPVTIFFRSFSVNPRHACVGKPKQTMSHLPS